MRHLVNLDDFEALARERLDGGAYDYMRAELETAMRLVGVTRVDAVMRAHVRGA